MVLITAEETGSALETERDAIAQELRTIREMVAALRSKVEAGETGTATEAAKALSELRAWLKHAKDTELYPIETGIRILQRNLKDAHGNAHIKITKNLARNRQGLVDYLVTAKRQERSQKVIKDAGIVVVKVTKSAQCPRMFADSPHQ